MRVDEAWLAAPRAALAAIDARHALSHSICERCADELNDVAKREGLATPNQITHLADA